MGKQVQIHKNGAKMPRRPKTAKKARRRAARRASAKKRR